MGSDDAIDTFDFEASVATLQLHFTFQIAQADLAVAGVQAHFAFARHADFDYSAAVSDAHDGKAVGEAHFEFDGIAGLMVMDLDAALSETPFAGSDVGFDFLFVPGFDVNLGVGGVHAQFGPAGNVEGLRPFFGLGSLGQGDGETETNRNPKETAHEDDSWDATRHTWDASLGRYVNGWREVPGIFASSEGRHVQKSFGLGAVSWGRVGVSPTLLGRARRPSLHLLVPIGHANEASFGKGQIQQSGGGGEGGSEAYLFGQEEGGDGPEFIDDQDRGVYALKLLS